MFPASPRFISSVNQKQHAARLGQLLKEPLRSAWSARHHHTALHSGRLFSPLVVKKSFVPPERSRQEHHGQYQQQQQQQHQQQKMSQFHTTSISRAKLTHYEILEVSSDASKKEIKSQFYKLSKLHHPDRNPSEGSLKKFLGITEAYTVLGNDRQRRDYDLEIRHQMSGGGGRAGDNSTTTYYANGGSSAGTLRRNRFRHSAQSAAAAREAAAHEAARNSHSAFRPTFGKGVPHFDSKSHQEMHYEQEIRMENRRAERERLDPERQRQQKFEESDGALARMIRISLILMMVVGASSFLRVFADEKGERVRVVKKGVVLEMKKEDVQK